MRRDEQINPGHTQIRSVLRIAGPLFLVAALVTGGIGLADFFSSMGTMEMPTKPYLLFIAMPLAFLGLTLTSAGFAGAVARYQAQEIAPVGKDTFNYMAEGTREGVATIAGAVAKGLRGEPSAIQCPECDTFNDADAEFCKSCREPLTEAMVCSNCGELNDADARFCDECGNPLT